MSYLTLKKSRYHTNEYEVFFDHDTLVGSIYMEIDGFYVLDMVRRPGFIASYQLRELANVLDKLNEPYQKQLDEFFKGYETTIGEGQGQEAPAMDKGQTT